MIRKANINDTAAIVEIYNYYVCNTIITFAETHLTKEEVISQMQERFRWYFWEERIRLLV